MDIIIRVSLIYLYLMVLLRASGRRALSELTGFDLILLLIAAEVTDSALLGHTPLCRRSSPSPRFSPSTLCFRS